jgi:hypothetical protein
MRAIFTPVYLGEMKYKVNYNILYYLTSTDFQLGVYSTVIFSLTSSALCGVMCDRDRHQITVIIQDQHSITTKTCRHVERRKFKVSNLVRLKRRLLLLKKVG